ncbi:hypothetical protein HMPREF3193_01816 [Bifidobacterium breve]|nr:hypothetical protein HMPREF1587_00270 [Bifidobacterium breve JCP7499]KWZ83890.1 hypothetical protein HMPREF3193_01816 [Bifidobacterium breve]
MLMGQQSKCHGRTLWIKTRRQCTSRGGLILHGYEVLTRWPMMS